MNILRHRAGLILAAFAASLALAACNGDGPIGEGLEVEDSVGGDLEREDEPLGADDAEGVTDGEDDEGQDG